MMSRREEWARKKLNFSCINKEKTQKRANTANPDKSICVTDTEMNKAKCCSVN